MKRGREYAEEPSVEVLDDNGHRLDDEGELADLKVELVRWMDPSDAEYLTNLHREVDRLDRDRHKRLRLDRCACARNLCRCFQTKMAHEFADVQFWLRPYIGRDLANIVLEHVELPAAEALWRKRFLEAGDDWVRSWTTKVKMIVDAYKEEADATLEDFLENHPPPLDRASLSDWNENVLPALRSCFHMRPQTYAGHFGKYEVDFDTPTYALDYYWTARPWCIEPRLKIWQRTVGCVIKFQ